MKVKWCLLAALIFCTGCTYLKNRGNDAIDMFDPGITLSLKPGFAIHLDFFNCLPLGYSHIEGVYLGLGNRQFGALSLHDHSWGYILRGREELQIGKFNPNDPHQVSPPAIAELVAAGKPLPTQVLPYREGMVGSRNPGNAPPAASFYS